MPQRRKEEATSKNAPFEEERLEFCELREKIFKKSKVSKNKKFSRDFVNCSCRMMFHHCFIQAINLAIAYVPAPTTTSKACSTGGTSATKCIDNPDNTNISSRSEYFLGLDTFERASRMEIECLLSL